MDARPGAFKPEIPYPCRTGETDASRRVEPLKDAPEIEVRVRRMQVRPDRTPPFFLASRRRIVYI